MAMVYRKERLQTAYNYVSKNPGCSPISLLEHMGKNNTNLDSLLHAMDENGFLISEDDGKLYPFEDRSWRRAYEQCSA